MGHDAENSPRVRLDRWLWAARFFKSRSLAAAAVAGGHVRVNGARAKASKNLSVGDQLTVTRGATTWTVTVRALGDRRRSAREAAKLYEESDHSRLQRVAASEQRRREAPPPVDVGGRPSKRDRRRLRRLRGRG